MDCHLELCLLFWGDVYMAYGDVMGYLWGIRWCIEGDSISYQHLLIMAVFDGDFIVLLVEQHSLEVDWLICDILQLDLLRGLMVTLNCECMAKDMCGTILHQRHRQVSHAVC